MSRSSFFGLGKSTEDERTAKRKKAKAPRFRRKSEVDASGIPNRRRSFGDIFADMPARKHSDLVEASRLSFALDPAALETNDVPEPIAPIEPTHQSWTVEIQAEVPVYAKSSGERDFLRKTLLSSGLVDDLPALMVDAVIDAFELDEPIDKNSKLVGKGQATDKVYVVCSGRFVIRTPNTAKPDHESNSIVLNEMGRGGVMCEAALILDMPKDQRKATYVIRSVQDGSVVYSLHRDVYATIMKREPTYFDEVPTADFLLMLPYVQEARKATASWLSGSAEFEQSLSELSSALTEVKISSVSELDGAIPRSSSSSVPPLVLIKTGQLCIVLKKRPLKTDSELLDRKITYTRGDVLGTDMLDAIRSGMGEGRISAYISTDQLTLLVQTPGSSLAAEATLPAKMLARVRTQYAEKLLRTNEAFAVLPPQELEAIVNGMRIAKFSANKSILKQGTVDPPEVKGQMYIVFQGAARAHRKDDDAEDTTLGFFDVGEQFGASAVSEDPNARKPRAVSTTAVSETRCFVLDRDVLGPSFERVSTLLKRDVSNRRWQLEHWGKVPFEELLCGDTIGSGSYGHVVKSLLMQKKKKIFAVKAVPKSMMLTSPVGIGQMLNERALMAACNHPFICRLVGGFQCKDNLYFVSELIEGGELFDLLSSVSFTLEQVLFYASNVAAALTHMHGKHVCHRDIKAENVMLESDGYLKLIDFGFAKYIGNTGRTATYCGTPHYMAPEIIRCEPHGMAVDIWATGCLVHEMIFGHVPFESESGEDTALEIFTRVMAHTSGKTPLKLPFAWGYKSMVHWHASDLVLKMLAASPGDRPTSTSVSMHPALEDYPLLETEMKQFRAPFSPDLDSFSARHRSLYSTSDQRFAEYTRLHPAGYHLLEKDETEERFGGFVPCDGWGKGLKKALPKKGDKDGDVSA